MRRGTAVLPQSGAARERAYAAPPSAPDETASLKWDRDFVSIFDGRWCVGHLIADRGRAWRAVEVWDCDLGISRDCETARRALLHDAVRSLAAA
jgi:hypothetical protein